MAPRSNEETILVRRLLLALGAREDVRIWRMNTGAAEMAGSWIRFGLPGQADISGILCNGRRLEIEAKAERGRQSQAQRLFQAMIEKYGGLYVLARSVEDAMHAVDDALRGEVCDGHQDR